MPGRPWTGWRRRGRGKAAPHGVSKNRGRRANRTVDALKAVAKSDNGVAVGSSAKGIVLDLYRIGEVAEQTGVSVETIRFYEREGLIPKPERQGKGPNRYPVQIMREIRFIRRCKDMGFSLKEIGEVLSLKGSTQSLCKEIHDRAEAKLVALGEQIQHLLAIRETLDELLGACDGNGHATACPLVQHLESEDG